MYHSAGKKASPTVGTHPGRVAYTGVQAKFRLNRGKGVDSYAASIELGRFGHRLYLSDDHLRGCGGIFLCGGAPAPVPANHAWLRRRGDDGGQRLELPAIEQSADFGVPGWLPAAAGLLLGVGFLSALDAVLPHLRRAKDMDLTRRQSTLLMAAITLHNVPEGMAVGLAFALAAEGEGMAGAAALALGIGIQNLPEGAAISLPLRQEGSSRGRAFLLGTLSGSVEPIFGILVVLVAAGVRPLMPWLLSFAAGAMLYVVVEELVPQAHSKAGTCGFVGGFLIMMILDVALG